MKGLKKKLLMLAVAMPLLFVSTPCARAQWFAEAAAEAALLTQQIAQFLQDLGFDADKWADVERRLKEVRNIAVTVSRGSQAVKNIANASGHIIRTGKTLVAYQEYLLEFGDNFKIERSYYIYKSFMRRTANVLDEVQTTVSSFERLRDTKPLQYIRSVEKATNSVSVVIRDLGDDAKADTAELCYDAAMDEVQEQNRKFYSLIIF